MSAITTPTDLKSDVKVSAAKLARWFYPATGVAMLLLTLVGFNLFYFRGQSYPGRPIPEPIRALVIVHGVIMLAWILLYLVQPALVALKKRKWHMAVGRVGAVVGVGVLVSGLMLAVRSAAITPPDMVIWGMTPKPFMAVPFISVLIFASFVGVGVWKRRRPDVHRAAMFLATLSAISAAVSRIDALNALYAGTVWDRLLGPFFVSLLIGGVLVALRCVLARRVERPLVLGYGLLVLLSLGIVAVARTDVWDAFASWAIS